MRTGQKETTTYHPVYQQNHHIKNDDNGLQSQDGPEKIGGAYHENDALKEFTVSKSDPKYQTLPYNTKFTVNLLPNRISRGENLENGEIKDGEHLTNVNMQTHMTVHSAPLNILNKNIATPLNQNDLLGKRQAEISNGPVQNGITYQVRHNYLYYLQKLIQNVL